MANVTMRQLLEAGVHFGHRTRYWNPQMEPYIFGQRNKIHIINLEETLPLLKEAVNYVGRLAANGGRVVFVGTKRAAREAIAEEAKRCGMPFVTHRWLGGTLTNFKTVKQSIKRLTELEKMIEDGGMAKLSKKEGLTLTREVEKLQRSLGGIKEMPSLPDCLFVIDVGYESIAIKEARKLGIPIVAVVDSNNSPAGIDVVIPGNDDATRAIRMFASVLADAIIDARGTVTTGAGSDAKAAEVKAAPKAAAKKPAEKKAAEPKAEAVAETAAEPKAEAVAETAAEPKAEVAAEAAPEADKEA